MMRRGFMGGVMSALGLAPKGAAAGSSGFAVTRSEVEWRALLSNAEYRVMRAHGTERAGSSALDKLTDAGIYQCRGCDQALYSSAAKYDSGTGWPSFWQAEPGAIGTTSDYSMLMKRTECHCSRCGSHLGHIFRDGPPPTGKRHCINGVSLVFKPA